MEPGAPARDWHGGDPTPHPLLPFVLETALQIPKQGAAGFFALQPFILNMF